MLTSERAEEPTRGAYEMERTMKQSVNQAKHLDEEERLSIIMLNQRYTINMQRLITCEWAWSERPWQPP